MGPNGAAKQEIAAFQPLKTGRAMMKAAENWVMLWQPCRARRVRRGRVPAVIRVHGAGRDEAQRRTANRVAMSRVPPRSWFKRGLRLVSSRSRAA